MKNSFLSDLVNMFLVVACIVSSVKIYSLSSDVIRLQNLNDMHKTVISDFIEELAKNDTVRAKTVTVSFYCPKLGGINGRVGESASGDRLKDGLSVAISRNLIDEGWYGTKIDMYGKNLPVRYRGIKISMDKMAIKNPYTGKNIVDQIDIYVSDPKLIPKEGIFKNVKITKIDKY